MYIHTYIFLQSHRHICIYMYNHIYSKNSETRQLRASSASSGSAGYYLPNGKGWVDGSGVFHELFGGNFVHLMLMYIHD